MQGFAEVDAYEKAGYKRTDGNASTSRTAPTGSGSTEMHRDHAIIETLGSPNLPASTGRSWSRDAGMGADGLPEMMTHPPTAKPRSAAAERMRAHRQRRRDGLRCVTVEIRDAEIVALIRKEMLKSDARNNLDAIRDALYAHLERTLGAVP